MKLRTQYLLGVGILIVVLLAMAAFAVVTRARVAELRAQHDIAVSLQQQANDLTYLSNNYLLYGEEAQKVRWEGLFESFSRDVDRLKATGSYDSAIISRIRSDSDRVRQVFADVAATAVAAGAGNNGDGQAFLQVSWSRMEVQNRQILFNASQLEDFLEARVDRANLVSNIVVLAMMGLFGVLLLTAYVLMYRRTIAGIAALRSGTEIVGRGNLDHVMLADRRDEIGDLSRAFNAMTTDLKSVTASKGELEKEVEQRRQAQAERELLLEELRAQNDELATREEELEAQNEELRVAEEETARLLAERNSLFERLQTGLLHIPQELPGVRFSHLYRSATEQAKVGGDFYDVFETREHKIGLLIGDVSGHGIEAARIATLVKDTVHAFAYRFRRPRFVLRETNRLLVKKNLGGFVTAFLAFLDPETGVLQFSSAGHPPPLLASDGSSISLDSIAFPLGIFAGAEYADKELVIAGGSLLVLYTDGITEARRGALFFGESGLRSTLSEASPMDVEGLPAFLLAEALRFSRGRLEDDVALLTVSYLGPSASDR